MAHDWKKWFEGYAADWVEGNYDAVAARYAPLFQAVKPGKNAVYPSDAGFRRWLERVRGFHLEAGLEKVEIVTTHTTNVGASHALVSVTWAVRFEKRSSLRIQFSISYLLGDVDGDTPRILAIISHEDQRAAMRRYEIIP
jgi:hypothetical protein